jgi:NDP-sugar pyrophosphorylase family protein
MRNLTKFLPKAMLPVAGRPLLSYSLLSLVQAGFQG